MSLLPENIQRLVEALNRLPGIGPKTAERLAFYLLRKPEQDLAVLSDAILHLKDGLGYCSICCNLSAKNPCELCSNPERDRFVICIVEELLDLIAIEKTNEYKGVYHVLHGVISPMDGVGPDDLKIAELVERIKKIPPKEIIFALNHSIEGEATAAYLMRALKPLECRVTRIARGLPVGGNLEYADSQTIRRALEGRQEY
ncbi:recombination protein RecR [Candidatus Peregrinibacteria bacterium]|nr:recombination protein RecR [Candidatus Peregrinibacteria bacterium]